MHRIDHPTRAVDLHGPGKDGYTEGDPVQGIAASVITADSRNAEQEEICNAIEGAGIPLDKADNTQLLQAMRLLAATDVAVANWTVRHSGAVQLRSVAVRPGAVGGVIAVAVGDEGVLLHSFDGFTWEVGNSGLSGRISAVTFGGIAWVAVGAGGKIIYSTNGLDWDEAAANTSEDLHAVAYADGVWIAVGNGGIARRAEGAAITNWNSVTTGTSSQLFAVVGVGDTWLAAGDATSSPVRRSTDAGLTWSAGGEVGGVVNDLAAGPDGAFVAATHSRIRRTLDGGLTWEPVGPSEAFASIAFDQARWVATRLGGGRYGVFSSHDGETWRAHCVPSELVAMSKVVWGPGFWIGAGGAEDEGVIATSLAA